MIAHRGPGIRYFFRKFSTKITLKSVHFAHKTAVCYIRAAEKKNLEKIGRGSGQGHVTTQSEQDA